MKTLFWASYSLSPSCLHYRHTSNRDEPWGALASSLPSAAMICRAVHLEGGVLRPNARCNFSVIDAR